MQRILLLGYAFLVFPVLTAFAVTPLSIQYKISGKVHEFEKTSDGKIISVNCKNKPCEAVKALSRQRKMQYGKNGENPGALICSKQLGGEVLIGVDAKGNQAALCRFKDKSMIAVSNLMN